MCVLNSKGIVPLYTKALFLLADVFGLECHKFCNFKVICSEKVALSKYMTIILLKLS